jgi:diadenosine tetraphosphate (Ap4A) HIT family hydrolase
VPSKIDKAEAIERLGRFLPPGTCSMCHLIENDQPLTANASAVLALNRFPLRWGHLLVVTRRHITTFEAIEADEHREVSELVLRGARILEHVLRPVRVFTASLGTGRSDIPMSSPHLHWQIVPTDHEGERPSEVLTWSNGVVTASEEEWADLRERLRDRSALL